MSNLIDLAKKREDKEMKVYKEQSDELATEIFKKMSEMDWDIPRARQFVSKILNELFEQKVFDGLIAKAKVKDLL